MESLDAFAHAKLASLEEQSLRRRLTETQRRAGSQTEQRSRTLVSFACNDYLGLSHHPEVVRAAAQAAELYGAGSGASRLITGNHPFNRELESLIAAWKETPRAMVFGSGYLANIGVIPALVGPNDTVFVDEYAHACLFAGARISQARVFVFRHNDLEDLARLLRSFRHTGERCLALTDGVFSMDGDIAPLAKMAPLCEEYDAWLLVDDAHGLGVVGKGKGSVHVHPEPVAVPLQMGTFSKAAGGYGGYLCASDAVISLLHSRARPFVYSTALPPPVLAANIAGLRIIMNEAERCAQPLQNARLFCATLGLPEPRTQIVPIVLGEPRAALEASTAMKAEGFLVTAIRPPTVPQGTSRLRFAFCSTHQAKDVVRAAECIAPWLQRAHPRQPA